jgi:peptidyl-prolyl cis-trans isomerase D
MLDIFRQRGLSNVIYGAVIVATILAFVLTFRPSSTQKVGSLSESCVARVRGRCIDPKDFSAAYRLLMPSRSPTLSRKMNLKRLAVDGLVERELLCDEAKRLGVGVTDTEVTDELYAGYVRVSVPAADPVQAQQLLQEMYGSYVRAGIVPQDVAQARLADRETAIPVDFRDSKTHQFDMKTYEKQVRTLSNRSTSEFREEQVREILAAKMRDIVRDPVRVSDAEAWGEYDRRFSTAVVTWIPVKESWAARWAVDVRQTDVDSWVKDHQADFDKTLEEHKKQDAPKAGHVRHILVKLPYGATEDEKATALAELSWAAGRIKAGESFAEVARDVSQDTGSGAQGGDVGDKTDKFVAPFRVAADGLKAGETTAGAVETQFGYHLITKDDPSKAGDVEAQVRKSLARSMYAHAKGTEAASAVALKVQTTMAGGKNAEDAIKDAIEPYVHTQKVEMLKVLPPPPAAADAGTDGATAAATDAGAGGGGTTQKKEKPAPPPEGTFDASSDPERPQTQTSSAFNRGGDPFQGLSPDGTNAIIAFAFSSKDADVLAQPVRTTDAFVVVQLKQHKTATREEFEKDHDSFTGELTGLKRDEALSLYVKRLRDQAKDDVKIDETYTTEAKADGGKSATEDEDEY